ncbi:TetR/AcrR family transcriptional regulator [Lactobacillus sp. ESL0731]|uniref:TetR/AcrR family transcriptional regulator n=1 Tax=unclassified Lactobacillus TaxID=2620435 RepID=UPI0023F9203D|nr:MULTISPECIES: TetR/AcrR family transcriptional regulator [unclassified Lactobacillus]WEV50606.1 TetR/AcrR family transcriptional regulator [Lactobacillus sp. ESL0700]WEV61736.1 TetR/AcrR family transcriptional regulator [Lactobacillus sp. ESL0731]
MNQRISTLFLKSLDNVKSTKQKAVLKAGLVLFSEKGFENTSTSDIAKKAGVAEGTVYKQFKTKEAILAAIITPIIEEVVPQIVTDFLTEITQEKQVSLKTFIHHILVNRLQFVVDNLPQVRILARELFTNQQFQEQIKLSFVKLFNSQLIDVFDYYKKQGQLVDWSNDRIIRYIAGTIASYLIPEILLPEIKIDVAQVSDEATEFLIKGLTPQK